MGPQAAADKGQIRRAVEGLQVAYGVQEIDLSARGAAGGLGAPGDSEPPALAQRKNLVETLGAPRGQDQQAIRPLVLETPQGFQDQRLLPGMGAGGDPHRPLWRGQHSFPDVRRRGRPGGRGQVELQVAHDRNLLRGRAQGPEPPRILGALRGNEAETAQGLRHEPPKKGVAPVGAIRHPPVHQRRRHPPALTNAQQIRPDLGFHDDKKAGLNRAQKGLRRPRQVVGQVKMVGLASEHLLRMAGAGGGDGGDKQGATGKTPRQGGNQGPGALDLAHRRPVDPDGPAAPGGLGREAQPFRDAPDAAGFCRPPQEQPQQRDGQQQVQDKCVQLAHLPL